MQIGLQHLRWDARPFSKKAELCKCSRYWSLIGSDSGTDIRHLKFQYVSLRNTSWWSIELFSKCFYKTVSPFHQLCSYVRMCVYIWCISFWMTHCDAADSKVVATVIGSRGGNHGRWQFTGWVIVPDQLYCIEKCVDWFLQQSNFPFNELQGLWQWQANRWQRTSAG